jgi:twitching motility two-component system response regulator PilG
MMRKIRWQKAPEQPLSLGVDMQPGATEAPRMATLHASRAMQGTKEDMTHPFVMVIDDSATVCKIMETCLRREGVSVRSFPDGINAIQWLTQPGVCLPDLLFLDIGLPKIDGYDVARHLKAKPQLHAMVIILLSRRYGVIDRLKGRLVGAREYFIKPFKTQDILQVVETYLGCSRRCPDER